LTRSSRFYLIALAVLLGLGVFELVFNRSTVPRVSSPPAPSRDEPEPASSPTQQSDTREVTEIQAVVRRYSTALQAACWRPALDERAPNAPDRVRVAVAVKIRPDGSVEAAQARQAVGYPGLADCVAQQIRQTWRFAEAAASTTVKLPLVFVAD
jgi:hypothetical protein